MNEPEKLITRLECEACGCPDDPEAWHVLCPAPPGEAKWIERTYIAVDALLSDEAIEAATAAILDNGDNDYRGDAVAAINAAVAVATEKQP